MKQENVRNNRETRKKNRKNGEIIILVEQELIGNNCNNSIFQVGYNNQRLPV